MNKHESTWPLPESQDTEPTKSREEGKAVSLLSNWEISHCAHLSWNPKVSQDCGTCLCHTQGNSPREMILNLANFFRALLWDFIDHISQVLTFRENYDKLFSHYFLEGEEFPVSIRIIYTDRRDIIWFLKSVWAGKYFQSILGGSHKWQMSICGFLS